ncbi:hypothetical protein V5799_015907 [Amblyomma americanum]|uniref:Uncharacterized protein n=1 Tax=Amblyomma americanum TaxID=6943 RepID=A0AAQ4F7W0_AMBAM
MSLHQPPEFLPTPGKPAIPWTQWHRLFKNYLLASGSDAHPPARRKALLLHCLGVEGQRLYYALPEEKSSTPPTEGKEGSGTSDEYDAAVATLDAYFTSKTNVVVERHRFGQRTQLPGETATAHENFPAEGQTASQKAARLFRTCEEILLQDTDYTPRIRGYMRDANLNWPLPSASIDVFYSMVYVNQIFNWPSLLDFRVGFVRNNVFQLAGLRANEEAHRRYFQTLFDSYGTGSEEGVTYEFTSDVETELLQKLAEIHEEPGVYLIDEFGRNVTLRNVTQRLLRAIRKFFNLSVEVEIPVVFTHKRYTSFLLAEVAYSEKYIELLLGWVVVQHTSRFANRQLIRNYYYDAENPEQPHRALCLETTIRLTGVALFAPMVQGIFTEQVRADQTHIVTAVRRTVFQTLARATYPWGDLDAVFHYIDRTRAEDIDARFSEYPDMESSFVKNLLDATRARHRTEGDLIGDLDPEWLRQTDFFRPLMLSDRTDYTLMPAIIGSPMYHVTAPAAVRLGTFGVEVARATVSAYKQLHLRGHQPKAWDDFDSCFSHVILNSGENQDQERRSVLAAALDVVATVLEQEGSRGAERLHDVPLSGRQLLYVAHCFTLCGHSGGKGACNVPLRHSEHFSRAFSCSQGSYMRSEDRCRAAFWGNLSARP